MKWEIKDKKFNNSFIEKIVSSVNWRGNCIFCIVIQFYKQVGRGEESNLLISDEIVVYFLIRKEI